MALISEDELKSVSVRRTIIETKKLEVSLLESELKMYFDSLIKKYELDSNKDYILNGRGVLEEKPSNP